MRVWQKSDYVGKIQNLKTFRVLICIIARFIYLVYNPFVVDISPPPFLCRKREFYPGYKPVFDYGP
jgi:hypothetical protein